MAARRTEPRLVAAGAARAIPHPGGETITVLLSGAATGGTFALVPDVDETEGSTP